MSSWAPMVPYAKDRLGLNEAQLGLLLLLLGGGALVTMPIAGIAATRVGSRIVMAISAGVMAATLPLLLLIPSVIPMAIALFFFGASIGSIDVAMNAHGVQVQNLYGRPIMSSLHGLFSVGGLFGSLGLGFLIKLGLNPIHAAIGIAALLILITAVRYKSLFTRSVERKAIERFATAGNQPVQQRFKWLHPRILFLGFMCFAAFLAEGAMLDWSAVFLRDVKGFDAAFSGAAYASFSIAMAIMRLLGDGLVTRLSGRTVVIGGSLIAAAGLLIAITSTWVPLDLFGFVLVGIGAANIVPLFFSEGGQIQGISPTISIPAITTMGYAGQLAGPALLGFIAHRFSLTTAFGCLAALLLVVTLAYMVRKPDSGARTENFLSEKG